MRCQSAILAIQGRGQVPRSIPLSESVPVYRWYPWSTLIGETLRAPGLMGNVADVVEDQHRVLVEFCQRVAQLQGVTFWRGWRADLMAKPWKASSPAGQTRPRARDCSRALGLA